MRRTWPFLPSLLLFALLAASAGCSGGLAFTPDQAAVESAMRSAATTDLTPDPDSMAVLQTQKLGDSTLVLLRFTALHSSGQVSECLHLYEVYRRGLGFIPGSGGGGCGPAGGEGEAFGVGMGHHSNSAPGRLTFSDVNGLLYDPDLVSIEILWDDGEVQQALVSNGSYLAVRQGTHQVETITGRDAGGEVLSTWEHPQSIPGKDG